MFHATLGAERAGPIEKVGADTGGRSTRARSATGTFDLPSFVERELGSGQRPVVKPARGLLAFALEIGIAWQATRGGATLGADVPPIGPRSGLGLRRTFPTTLGGRRAATGSAALPTAFVCTGPPGSHERGVGLLGDIVVDHVAGVALLARARGMVTTNGARGSRQSRRRTAAVAELRLNLQVPLVAYDALDIGDQCVVRTVSVLVIDALVDIDVVLHDSRVTQLTKEHLEASRRRETLRSFEPIELHAPLLQERLQLSIARQGDHAQNRVVEELTQRVRGLEPAVDHAQHVDTGNLALEPDMLFLSEKFEC